MEQDKEDLEKTVARTSFKLRYTEPVTFFQDESQVALSGVFLPSIPLEAEYTESLSHTYF